MGLNIYFLDEIGEDVEIESYLGITHNLNKLVDECGKICSRNYYELIWKPDELFNFPNGKVPVKLILNQLPTLIDDLLTKENELKGYLPSNGYGTFDGLISFLCDYLKECYRNKDSFVYCCR